MASVRSTKIDEGKRMPEPGAPAAWYPDPTTTGLLRWWDGHVWTERTHLSSPEPATSVEPLSLASAVPAAVTAEAYGIRVSFDGQTLTVEATNFAARSALGARTRTIQAPEITALNLSTTTAMKNGTLTVVTATSKVLIHYRGKHTTGVTAVYDALTEVAAREAATAPAPVRVPQAAPPVPGAAIVTVPAAVTAGALRGTSFGDHWIEVHAAGKDQRALDKVVAKRGRTGPKSLRVDDAVVTLARGEVQVLIGDTRVGVLEAADTAAYTPVLGWARHPIESSGIVIIDADGHPGQHLKLYLTSPDMLVPANALDPAVAVFPAWDRAGGLTLAKRKADHALTDAATASWWAGTPRSAWVVLTRSGFEITATMDRMPLPALDPNRDGSLRSAWEARHHELTRMQFEAQVYEIKPGRQINIRYPLS
jgi:hypothetical protein